MATLTKAEVIKRLGIDPKELEFRGQCYDAGGHPRICALTLQPTRFVFTLTRKVDTKGRVVVSPAAFLTIKRYAPALYLQLERGRLSLQLYVAATDRDMHRTRLRQSLTDLKSKFYALRVAVKKRVSGYRLAYPGGDLPGEMLILKTLATRQTPVLVDYNHEVLWFEAAIAELEAALLIPGGAQ